jgi:hypothetical protein
MCDEKCLWAATFAAATALNQNDGAVRVLLANLIVRRNR